MRNRNVKTNSEIAFRCLREPRTAFNRSKTQQLNNIVLQDGESYKKHGIAPEHVTKASLAVYYIPLPFSNKLHNTLHLMSSCLARVFNIFLKHQHSNVVTTILYLTANVHVSSYSVPCLLKHKRTNSR